MRTAFLGGTMMLLTLAAAFTGSVPSPPPAVPTTGEPRTGSQDRANLPTTTHASASKRKIPCKTAENASICYWTHGRLAVYNGNPSARIWKIGTRRLLGVYNGPSHFPPRSIADDESPELPSNLERAYEIDYRHWKQSDAQYYEYPIIFADFEVCPLEPEKEGWMQAVCIDSAKNLYIEKGWR